MKVTTRNKHVICRDLKFERELLRSARWNSSNGRRLFHEGNRGFLSSMATCHVPGASDSRSGNGGSSSSGQGPVMVGFLQCRARHDGEEEEEDCQLVYLPFLVLPKKGANKTPPVDSGAIAGEEWTETENVVNPENKNEPSPPLKKQVSFSPPPQKGLKSRHLPPARFQLFSNNNSISTATQIAAAKATAKVTTTIASPAKS